MKKIWVCLKQVPDTTVRIQLMENQEGIKESDIEWIINPYDEFALEEALRIKERETHREVCVLSYGPERVEKALRAALAMGADKAFRVEEDSSFEPPAVFSALAETIKQEGIGDLILTGKCEIDHDHFAGGPMLAEALNLPHIGFITAIKEVEEGQEGGEGGRLLCERQITTDTKEQITLKPPALITVEKGINEPRYPSLPGIMRAKQKPLKKISLSALNLSKEEAKPLKFYSYSFPPPPPTPKIFSGPAEEQVEKLLQILKEK